MHGAPRSLLARVAGGRKLQGSPAAMLEGNVPASYFNVGTQYFIGDMASATEVGNVFTIPVTGAGPCPNGAMRSGVLTVTCGAEQTAFSVNEDPMCTVRDLLASRAALHSSGPYLFDTRSRCVQYDMYYSTKQACPAGTVLPSAAAWTGGATTSDLAAHAATPEQAPPATPLCGGAPFSVTIVFKTECLHVKGVSSAEGFAVSTLKRPVVSAACSPGSPNQLFTLLPSAEGGSLVHVASSLLLSLSGPNVQNGAGVSLAAPRDADAITQEWIWPDAMTGGIVSAVADPNFQITDALSLGLPVHM